MQTVKNSSGTKQVDKNELSFQDMFSNANHTKQVLYVSLPFSTFISVKQLSERKKSNNMKQNISEVYYRNILMN